MASSSDTFYKYNNFWWSYPSSFSEPGPISISGPFCLNCQTDLVFPEDAEDGWEGKLKCSLCKKEHEWKGDDPWEIKKIVSQILISRFRSSLNKVSLEEPITQVKVRDEDDIYFIAAKIGQKDGKRVGVVYFGEKNKDQKKTDYSQIFIDLDDEQIRFDKSNKHPKKILAKMKVEFSDSAVNSTFKKTK